MAKNIKYKIKKIKSHVDERGWLVELFKKTELEKPLKQTHISSLKQGYIRGNHFHKKRMEWFFVISGEADLYIQDIDSKTKKIIKLDSKNQRVVTIMPNLAHAIKNTSKETVYFIAGQSDIYNPKRPDAIPFKLI